MNEQMDRCLSTAKDPDKWRLKYGLKQVDWALNCIVNSLKKTNQCSGSLTEKSLHFQEQLRHRKLNQKRGKELITTLVDYKILHWLFFIKSLKFLVLPEKKMWSFRNLPINAVILNHSLITKNKYERCNFKRLN